MSYLRSAYQGEFLYTPNALKGPNTSYRIDMCARACVWVGRWGFFLTYVMNSIKNLFSVKDNALFSILIFIISSCVTSSHAYLRVVTMLASGLNQLSLVKLQHPHPVVIVARFSNKSTTNNKSTTKTLMIVLYYNDMIDYYLK